MKQKKRIGRGGKRGTYSGKGTKGQLARSGRKLRPELRDIIKKIPKKRGYSFSSFREGRIGVPISVLEKNFEHGAIIGKAALLEKKLITAKKSKNISVKILGNTPINKKFTLTGLFVSAGARKAIEKAGGLVQ